MLFTIISEDQESVFSIKKVYTVMTVTVWYWPLKVLNECLLVNTKWIKTQVLFAVFSLLLNPWH